MLVVEGTHSGCNAGASVENQVAVQVGQIEMSTGVPVLNTVSILSAALEP